MDIGKMKKDYAESFQADPAAKEKIKASFLNAFTLKFPARPISAFLNLAGLLAAFLVLINSTVIVYAEKNEVPPYHVLYGYKRLSEKIQTAVSGRGQKTALQKKFAARRLKEMEDVKKNGPSLILEKLGKDFRKEIHAALESEESNKKTLCGDIKSLIKKHKELTGKNEKWEKFKKTCSEDPDR